MTYIGGSSAGEGRFHAHTAGGEAVGGPSDGDEVVLVHLQAGGDGVAVAAVGGDGDGDGASGLGGGWRGRSEGEAGEKYAANYAPKSGGG